MDFVFRTGRDNYCDSAIFDFNCTFCNRILYWKPSKTIEKTFFASIFSILTADVLRASPPDTVL